MNRPFSASPIQGLARFVLWIVFPLLVGTVLAAVLVPAPQVGVIRFRGEICFFESWMCWQSIDQLCAQLDRARDDPNIRAVVLELDSPGGEVEATEELYYRLLELRQKKPLVVTVNQVAASGGYYIAAAGDHIFAKPASTVGNIGVISPLPSRDQQRFTDEDYVSTGPFKFSGGSRGDFVRQMELAKLGFLEAVFAQRGDKLRIDRETLSGGEVFLGMQALQLGLIDELGANGEAVQKAASLANLTRYQVVDVADLILEETPESEESEAESGAEGHFEMPLDGDDSAWQPGLYYLYIEPEKRRP